MTHPLPIGTIVRWTSQSAGIVKTKQGAIREVVPAGRVPTGIKNPGASRDHVSYVVLVRHPILHLRIRRYWPRVSKLEVVAP